jgi:hypothetical protein
VARETGTPDFKSFRAGGMTNEYTAQSRNIIARMLL